ncbi:MAG: FtsX-like permease family protein [Promethearchaeota archaeon]
MGMRLFGKAIRLAMRSRKRYIIFTLTYMALMLWTSISIQNVFNSTNPSQNDWYFFWVGLAISVFISILFSWIIINYRRTEIATLKCIGYTNSNVRTIIVGEIIWVTFSGFILVVEILIHFIAGQALSRNLGLSANPVSITPFLTFSTILINLALFLVVQIFGIIIAYRRVLKVRPIMALRIMK